MENKETCTFVLRTSDIVDGSGASLNNGSGIKNDLYGASYTWYNINIKSMLGNLWDDYDYFQLSLVAVPINVLSTSSLTIWDKWSTIYMKGLNWSNCNFNHSNKTNNIKACIGMISMSGISTTACNIDTQAESIVNCFTKGNPIIDLTIDIFATHTDTLNVPANSGAGCIYPQMNYIFSVNPIKREQRTANLFLKSITDSVFTSPSRKWRMYYLKSALGDMWDDYDTFSITLVEAYTTGTGAVFTGDDVVLFVRLTGLPFIHPTSNSADVAVLNLTGLTTAVNIRVKNNNTNTFIFKKPSTNADLVINFYQMDSNLALQNTTNINEINYLFKIAGVK